MKSGALQSGLRAKDIPVDVSLHRSSYVDFRLRGCKLWAPPWLACRDKVVQRWNLAVMSADRKFGVPV
jgi:hypothetical protein